MSGRRCICCKPGRRYYSAQQSAAGRRRRRCRSESKNFPQSVGRCAPESAGPVALPETRGWEAGEPRRQSWNETRELHSIFAGRLCLAATRAPRRPHHSWHSYEQRSYHPANCSLAQMPARGWGSEDTRVRLSEERQGGAGTPGGEKALFSWRGGYVSHVRVFTSAAHNPGDEISRLAHECPQVSGAALIVVLPSGAKDLSSANSCRYGEHQARGTIR